MDTVQRCAVNVSVIGGFIEHQRQRRSRDRDGEVEKPWFFSKLNLLLPFKKFILLPFLWEDISRKREVLGRYREYFSSLNYNMFLTKKYISPFHIFIKIFYILV